MQLVSLFTAYFAEFTEAAIKNNFVLIYELLDEASTLLLPAAQVVFMHIAGPCACSVDLRICCCFADAGLWLAPDGRPSRAEAVHLPEGAHDTVSTAETGRQSSAVHPAGEARLCEAWQLSVCCDTVRSHP